MMKKCSKCGVEKPATAEFFPEDKGGKDGLRADCKECRTKVKRLRGRKYKKLLIEHFGGKCVTCGYDRCPAGFDFHHIIPEEKEFSIGENCGNFAYGRLLKEVKKCMLLCSNCHRELHYLESLKKDD
jgi:hypothetical protein